MVREEKSSPKGEAAAEREARLSEALRENLRKRKRQARARKGREGDSEPEPGKA